MSEVFDYSNRRKIEEGMSYQEIVDIFSKVSEKAEAAEYLRDIYKIHRFKGNMSQEDAFNSVMADAKKIHDGLPAGEKAELIWSELLKAIENDSSVLDSQYFREK